MTLAAANFQGLILTVLILTSVVLTGLVLAATPAIADDGGSLEPSPYFGAAATSALDRCIAGKFVITDVNDAEVPIPDCAHIGARICTDAAFAEQGKPLDEACAMAEFQWWLARMEPAVKDLTARLASDARLGQDARLARMSQTAWQDYAGAQCDYDASIRGAGRFACLSQMASQRAAWLLTWAAEF